MVASLLALWVGFHVASEGIFLSPRNLVNLAVQTSAVGMMAMGMVFVIACRHIDLSVGSVLGFVGMVIAALQLGSLGLPPLPWPLALVVGLGLAAAIGAWHGIWVAHGRLPAFVVTLAGLLIFRGAAWLVSDGQTLAPLPEAYTQLGGGLHGVLPSGASWLVTGLGLTGWAAVRWNRRQRSIALGTTVGPAWREAAVVCAGAAALLGFVGVAVAVPVRGDAGPASRIPSSSSASWESLSTSWRITRASDAISSRWAGAPAQRSSRASTCAASPSRPSS